MRYEERPRVLKITSLETRRKRGDLKQFFRMQHDIDHVGWKNKMLKIIQGEKYVPVASHLRKRIYAFIEKMQN